MKKRILAVLLMVVILAALMAGLSVTAAAENDISGDTISGYVIPYTLKAGDTVLKVCNTLGIDFHKNQALITKINSIADYSKLPVGKVVWLPATSVGSASNYYTLKSHKVVSGDNVNTLLTKYSIASTDAMLSKVNNNLASPVVGSTITFPVYTGSATAKMADTTATAIGTATAAAATATGISTTTATTVPASGSVAYYLLAYQMKAGDTVGAVCTANGINFSHHSALITRINGITNYNRIPVGRVIMLPTATATGATYSVIAHQIQAGETANAICASYGINLATNLTLIKGLNNTNNLNYIQAGGLLYVPVAGGSGGGGGEGGGGGIVPPTPGTAYKLSKDDCDNGSFVLKVDGVEATSAAAGKTVSIVSTGKGGYVQKTVVAHLTGDTTKVVPVTNNTFVMPEFNVTVNVTFGKATNYTLTCKAPVYGTGAYELTVDNKIVTSQTYAGAVVTVKPKPAANYMLDKIKVTYIGSDGKDKEVAVTDNKFTMPNANATVEVTFKPSAGYEYPLNKVGTSPGGTFEFEAGTKVVSKTKSGMRVWIRYKADTGYKLDTVTIEYKVWNAETELPEVKTVKVSDAQFIMPTFDDEIGVSDRYVNVKVEFIKSKVYNITIKEDTAKTGNSVTARINEIDGTAVTKTEEGRNIIIVPKYNKNGYELKSVTWINESTKASTTLSASDLVSNSVHFVMPAANVTIIPTYTTAALHSITAKPDPSWAGTLKFTVNATPATQAKQGETVNMTITPVNTDVKLKSVKVFYKYANNTEVEVPVSGNNFTMPAYNVEVKAEFELATFPINTTANTHVDKVEYFVNSQLATRATPGDNVLIKPAMKSGYAVKKIEVTYVDSKGKTQEVSVVDNVFVMPVNVATVTITEETTDGSFEINVIDTSNGTAKVVDRAKPSVTMTRANNGFELQIVCEPSTYYEVDTVTYKPEGGSETKLTTAPYNFDMPNANVEVKVTFKAKTFALSAITVDSSIGSIKVTDNGGKEISAAQYGDTVKIETTVKDGYKLVSVGAKNKDTGVPYVTGNSFQMPAFDVEVYAEFVALKKNLELTANDAVNGTFTLQVGGADVTKANEGDTVTVVAVTNGAYLVDTITVVTKSGNTVPVTGYTFTMPDESVTVTVTFKEG